MDFRQINKNLQKELVDNSSKIYRINSDEGWRQVVEFDNKYVILNLYDSGNNILGYVTIWPNNYIECLHLDTQKYYITLESADIDLQAVIAIFEEWIQEWRN